MKKFLKIIGVVTSIFAAIAGITVVLNKFCKKKCCENDIDEDEDEKVIEIEITKEDSEETEDAEEPAETVETETEE